MKTLMTAALLACAGAASAQVKCDLASLNPSFFDNAGGSGALNGTTGATVKGGDAGVPGNTEFCMVMPAAGDICFDWQYFSSDSGCFDTGYVSINGSVFTLACNTSAPIGGSVVAAVNAGDVVCFGVATADGIFGPGILEVSNFYLKKIPAPGSLALVGAAGLLAARRRR